MGRLVEAPRRVQSQTGSHRENAPGGGPRTDTTASGDNFIDRVVKYIPGEILATYITLDRFVAPDAKALRMAVDNGTAKVLSNREFFDLHLPDVLFYVLLVLTPFYIWWYAAVLDVGKPWRRQALVATVAFAIWAYALGGGYFSINGFFVEKYAAILVAIFTILSGFVQASHIADDDTKVDVLGGTKSGAVNNSVRALITTSVQPSASSLQSQQPPSAQATSARTETSVGQPSRSVISRRL
jgi:4-amino-4-deoxy-L-arabinose transferase-like glycosyltransferase